MKSRGQRKKKILLIRFSAFGDVLQSLSIPGRIQEDWPGAEIHWVTREAFVPLIETHPVITKVFSIRKGSGLKGLLQLASELKKEKYTHIYDAHNNLRSHLLGWFLNGLFAANIWLLKRHYFLRRPIYRWKRFLLFKIKKNTFPKPFNGQGALLAPLAKWGLQTKAPPTPQLFFKQEFTSSDLELPKSFIALAPSSAHELKKWPLEYFERLIQLLPEQKFVTLGGPEDTFIEHLSRAHPERVLNLAGKLSLFKSAQVIDKASLLVSNDTGLMHVAEQRGIPCIALMGPAPFGFPSRPRTLILERKLSCRPCSKHGQGPCINPEYQKCLRDILPEEVAQKARKMLLDHPPLLIL